MLADLNKKSWQWVALLFLAFVWGASFILMKKGLVALSYVQVAGFRMLFSFVVLLPIIVKRLKLLNRGNVVPLVLCGLLGNFFPAFLFPLAQTHLSSSLASILNGLTPFFTLLIGVFFFKNRPTILQYIGVLTGFIGASLLITNGDFSSFGGVNGYALLIVLATFMYGINGNLVRFKLSSMSGVDIAALVFLFIGPMGALVLPFTDMSVAYASPYFWESLFAVFVLALFGSVITLFIYYNLIHKAGVIFSASTTYIIPFFALMWGLLDGEVIGVIHLLCLVLILFGVYLSSRRRKAV